jgi:PhoPQ-activated pathogenicity-related protein
MRKMPLAWSTFIVALLLGEANSARAGLLEYVQNGTQSFSWKLKKKIKVDLGTVYDIHLVSQNWQGIEWVHQLQIYLPTGVKPSATMFLWNQGGTASVASMAMGMDLAKKMNAPVAFLYNIPNQPLFDGKKEDALIAETFVRFLQTGDENWPLLFPMVKSLVRAMDAIQEFAKQEWNVEVTQFVVSGGSKRGWTSWLTAAADARVKAFAPLVIDTLNMRAQIPHQKRSFGKYSEMIRDYTHRGLVPMPNTPEAKKLWNMVDPWIYRDRLTQPKMIINGANDPYWALDALNLYWNDLKGDKWVLYVPNAGHGLEQKQMPGGPSRMRARNTLAAFARMQIHDEPMPRLRWQHTDAADKLRLTVAASPAPRAARVWSTRAETKDFRRSTWTDRPLPTTGKNLQCDMDRPNQGFLAFFMELEYEIAGMPYFLSTQLRIAESK